MNQRNAVFAAISAVVGDVNGKVELTDAQKDAVYERLFTEFKTGNVEYKGGVPDDTKLKKYIPGLVNNWMRKDTRLNGGTTYQTKNPGSRAGSGDETMKAMKALLAATADPNARAAIQSEIAKRAEELKPRPTIDVSKLPEHLRNFVPASIRS